MIFFKFPDNVPLLSFVDMDMFKKIPIIKKLIEVGSAMLIVVLLSFFVGLILAYPVKWLWNFVFGSLLTITVFQAWAMNVLAGILFGHRNSGK